MSGSHHNIKFLIKLCYYPCLFLLCNFINFYAYIYYISVTNSYSTESGNILRTHKLI